jgi:hypothetical protein
VHRAHFLQNATELVLPAFTRSPRGNASEAFEAAPSRKITLFIVIWPSSALNRKVATRHFRLDASDAVPCRRHLLGDR